MQEKAQDKTVTSIFIEPKLPIDVGRGLLSIFLALSGLSLTLAKTLNLDNYLQIAVFSFAIICLLLTARTFDWMLDSITCESWAKLSNRECNEKFRTEFTKNDGFNFRLKIYDHSYFSLSCIISIILYLVLFFLLNNIKLIYPQEKYIENYINVARFVAITPSIYVLYQMMTIESKYSRYIFMAMLLIFFVAGITAALMS